MDVGVGVVQLERTNDLSARVLAAIEAAGRRTLLTDANSSFTGAGLGAFLEDLSSPILQHSNEGGRIGVRLDNSAVLAAAILGVIALKRVPVVLSPRTGGAARPSSSDALICNTATAPSGAEACCLIRVGWDGRIDVSTSPVAPSTDRLPRSGTAVVLYTSGSEGEPKGVQLSHAAIGYTVDHLIDRFRLDQSTVSVSVLPLHHTMGLNTQFLPTFFAGGRSVFVDTVMGLSTAYRTILESGCTFLGLVTRLLALFRDERARRRLPAAGAVRQVQLAGGPLRHDDMRLAADLFPGAVIHRGYGLTEAIRVAQSSSEVSSFLENAALTVLPGQRIEIRDEEGRSVPTGTVGEIFVGGPNLMLGYEHDLAAPPADGFLATGDLGELALDGQLVVHGRRDAIFKVDGERVSGTEIERAGSSLLPGVRDVRCLPVESEGRVRAVLFLETDRVPSAGEITAMAPAMSQAVRDALAHPAKRPSSICVMRRFPRTGNGKVCNASLKDMLAPDSTFAACTHAGITFRLCTPIRPGPRG